jgi:LAO/AO transport system kinase
MHALLKKMFSGDRTTLARLITHVESRSPEMPEIMAQISPKVGRAQVIGITGPPGAGKSTLVDQLIGQYRKKGKKVAVVAVDPSSPFSGGALLGDRIRMMNHAEDSEVFIRSLSSRGAHGGLSRATRDVVRLFDAFGMDLILVETVGVGQTEMDVLDVAHTTVVVLTPESGDTIQTLKAGLLEAADLFVVNKADREGAHRIHQELLAMIEMGKGSGFKPNEGWEIPVVQTQAHQGKGIDELIQVLRPSMGVQSESHRKKQGNPPGRVSGSAEEMVEDQLKILSFERKLKGNPR